MKADEILKKHEDANEMHFHEVDRKWIIEAMEEYAALRQTLVSGRSEQLAIDELKLISTAHSEGWSRDIAKDALKEIANCH